MEKNRNGAESDPTNKTTATAAPATGSAGFYVAGIGASAGGLEALEQLFRHMPANGNVGFVVIQHLSPDYKSLMVELLSKHTDMAVVRAEHDMPVEPNRIYLIPPKKNMTIYMGRLQLREKESQSLINLPIDIFFESLAEDMGDRSVGIVLSGTGSDGTRGVKALKAAGGMIMVQDEASAKFNGMPRSAVATGVADFILAPHEIPSELMSYVLHRRKRDQHSDNLQLLHEDDRLAKIFQLVKNQTGTDYSQYKSSTAMRRIQRRLHVNRIESLADYLQYLLRTPREVTQLHKEMLIGVTNFFRDPSAFECLQETIIPDLLKGAKSDQAIRVWSSGCATGEEAYSLAILFSEAMDKYGKTNDVKIFATDIDRDALKFASSGSFPDSIAADLSQGRLQKYFSRAAGKYQIARHIREMVVFSPHNLIKDPPFTRIDLICCRNLLIYLKPVLQKKIFSFFQFALNPNAYLMLGSSESIGDFAEQFRTMNSKWKIYQLREGAKNRLAQTLRHSGSGGYNRGALPRLQRISRQNDKGDLLEAVCRTLIESQNKSCIVVNERHQLTYVFGDVQELISFSSGQASLDILKLVPKALSLALNTTLHRAKRESKTIHYNGVIVKDAGRVAHLNVSVRRVALARQQNAYYFIFIEAAQESIEDAKIDAALDLQEQAARRLSDLEHDLQFTHENLQATIEELETSNEELQATNEELLSSNEELQSTNEELQSVNEELYTVNTEYQNKIQEMTELTNDINNLMRCTDIGSVFLDEQLVIRRFTPASATYINLIDKDIGRSFFDLSHRLNYATFVEDAHFVLQSQEVVAKEVKHVDGDPVLIKIFPYQDEFKESRGIVINFVDLSVIKRIEIDLMRIQKEKDVILDSVSDVIVYYNKQLQVAWANRAAFDVFAKKPEELIGQNVDQVWDATFDTLKEMPAHTALKSGRPIETAITIDGDKLCQLKDIPIKNNNGQVRAVVEFARWLDNECQEITTLQSAE